MESIQTCAGYRSNHSLVVMNMIFTHQERGRWFWKFNNPLLSDPAYVRLVKDCINETVDEYKINGDIEHPESLAFSINDQLLCETLKLQIFLMQHGRKKSKIRLKFFLKKKLILFSRA